MADEERDDEFYEAMPEARPARERSTAWAWVIALVVIVLGWLLLSMIVDNGRQPRAGTSNNLNMPSSY